MGVPFGRHRERVAAIRWTRLTLRRFVCTSGSVGQFLAMEPDCAAHAELGADAAIQALQRGWRLMHCGLSPGHFVHMLLNIKDTPKNRAGGLAPRGPSKYLENSEMVRSAGSDRSTCAAFRGGNMNALKMAGIALIAAGILGLMYGSFSYTKETHEAKIGPIELSVKDKQTVNVPVWAGVGAIVIGGALLVFGGKRG